MPFLVIVAGRRNSQQLLENVAAYTKEHEIVIEGLSVEELSDMAEDSMLLAELFEGMTALRNSLETGDPAEMEVTMLEYPTYNLRTTQVVEVEARMECLREAEQRLTQATKRMDSG